MNTTYDGVPYYLGGTVHYVILASCSLSVSCKWPLWQGPPLRCLRPFLSARSYLLASIGVLQGPTALSASPLITYGCRSKSAPETGALSNLRAGPSFFFFTLYFLIVIYRRVVRSTDTAQNLALDCGHRVGVAK